MSWSRAFHVPIATPDGLMLRTLRDAGEYIQALPRGKYKQPEWEIAAETRALLQRSLPRAAGLPLLRQGGARCLT